MRRKPARKEEILEELRSLKTGLGRERRLDAACLMLGLMLLAMFLTHDSLQGLRLSVADPQPGFASSAVVYPLRLISRTPRQRLQCRFQGGTPLMVEAFILFLLAARASKSLSRSEALALHTFGGTLTRTTAKACLQMSAKNL